MTRRLLLLGALALVWAWPVHAADLRRLEAVGAAPIYEEGGDRRSPRELALRRAVGDAVGRVASEEARRMDPADAESAIARALGKDPFAYANRYKVVEDRGPRAALFTREEGVENEYVLVVEVYVDVEKVRRRLSAAGLAVPSGGRSRTAVRIVIERLEGAQGYAALRRALVREAGARSTLPVEMEAGRAVLEVDSDRSADSLLDALLASGDPGLRITPLRTEGNTLYLRVSYEPPPPPPVGAGSRTRRGGD